MKVKDIRIIIALLVMIGTFAILAGGNFIYQRYFVQQPLAILLEQNTAVQSYHINQHAGQVIVTVELADVENLQQTYHELQELTQKHAGSKIWQLSIVDQRSPNLERIWQNSQFALYEAVVQGNFTHMADLVDQKVKEAKIDRYGLYVDDEYLYLQLHQDKNYLYTVIPRSPGLDNQNAPMQMASDEQGGKTSD